MTTPISYPDYIDLTQAQHVRGQVTLPGSKSISNRILLLSALASGTTTIKELLSSDDTAVMLSALKTLGVQWTRIGESQDYIVYGTNGHFPVAQADLFMGNAGTAIRPLTAALTVLGGDYHLHGVPRMHERPIGDLVNALNQVGFVVDYEKNAGYPPIHIRSGQWNGQALHVKGNVSSQFLTALLMASPLMATNQDVTLVVEGELISKPYIEITCNLMQRFGVHVQRHNWQTFIIKAGQSYVSPKEIYVEGDASSASYFLAAAAITGSEITVKGVGKNSIQGDIRFVDVLSQMGAIVSWHDNAVTVSSTGVLKALDIDLNHIPDAAMTVAMLALYADGVTTLHNIGSWRVKETDRLTAMATELRKVGAEVEEGDDYLRITPPKKIVSAEIKTYDDHRMAMCFSLASLSSQYQDGAAMRILDPQCVAKTFPHYFEEFAKIRD